MVSEMIILTKNPGDYNLPFPTWYENQRTMAERATNLEQGQVLFIESPTGAGKSASPMLVSYHRPGTTVCVATRDLQEQYADSFDDVAIVWGQAHYPCVNEPRLQEFQDAYGYTPTREDCPYRKPKDCPVYDKCPYEQSKIIALQSRAKVGNYAYMYYTNWWRGDNVNDLFCDEAHRLPRVLSDLISLEIAERTRVYYGLSQFPCISGGTRYAYRKIAAWANVGAKSLHPNAQKDPKRRLRVKRMRLKLKSLAESLITANPGTWYVASGQALGKLLAKPVHPGHYARKILDPGARSITLMSATIGDPGLLAEELGLSQDFEFLTLPHIFPKEHRPIIWMSESPRIRASTTNAEYKHQAAIIAKILNSHKGQKGLLHTVSWRHTKLLAELLSKNGCGSRLYIPEGERLQAIERFKQADTDLVALTPSWHEGLNFPDDEARFAIIAKINYLSLGDQVVKLRLHSPGGNKWYRWQAALGVVQSAGRIVRHRDDWGITYIVDSEWPRVAKYAPAWFEVEEA